jgi:hypothetical protein
MRGSTYLLIECAGELSCTSPKNYPAVDVATRSNKGFSAFVITRSSMQFNSLFLGREPLPYCRRLEIVCQKVTGTKLEVKDSTNKMICKTILLKLQIKTGLNLQQR